jgi:hypothetical protein
VIYSTEAGGGEAIQAFHLRIIRFAGFEAWGFGHEADERHGDVAASGLDRQTNRPHRQENPPP